MQTVVETGVLREVVAGWRRAGQRIAFVPTMGNIHSGHLSLIEKAQRRADRVIASIFVNPLQFGLDEDFDAYPRTQQADARQLSEAGVDLLFCPTAEAVYPAGNEATTRVTVPGITKILCGAQRPGHFTGVATVVAKLFNLVRPDLAVFGAKDYQQLIVIRRMTADLCMTVEIVDAPIFREPDGLAMSSRNRYLTADERETAPLLCRTLSGLADAVRSGDSDYSSLQHRAIRHLSAAGFRPNYIEVRKAANLELPEPGCRELVVVGAAWLGKARLIDNVPVSL